MKQHSRNPAKTYREAAEHMADTGWGSLDFFSSGRAAQIAATVDGMMAAGVHVLPAPGDVFNALHLTPPHHVRAVILGQDPYPTPGDAHGLAFSVAGAQRKLPMSLRTVFQALEADCGVPPPDHGNLTGWARNGVLLLNTSLTVEAGKANAHKDAGWQELAAQVMDFLNARNQPLVFMLWGKQAQAASHGIDRERHCVIETVHPSPLARGSGQVHRFVAAQPFRQAAKWLDARGIEGIDWRVVDRPEAE